MKLTDGQQSSYDYLVNDFPNSPLGTQVLLTGSAGTGKTTLQVEVLKAWDKAGINFRLTALTHKSAAVVRNMLIKNGLPGDVSTIHSALKLRLDNNKKTGEVRLVQSAKPDLQVNSILCIDEISMASDEIYDYICSAANELGLLVLMIGDLNQLPPVKSVDVDEFGVESIKVSPVFTAENINRLELTETVRQPGASPIVDLARNFITSSKMPRINKIIENEHGRVELVNHSQLMKRAKELVLEAHDNNDPNYVITLAYTNTAVINYNNKLRAHVYGDVPPYQPGERLIVNEATQGKDCNGLKTEMINNEPVVIESSREDRVYGIHGYQIILDDGREVFAAKNTAELIRAKKSAARNKDWPTYFALKDQVADLRNSYAVTVHKSQSSTYAHVLIDMGDIHSGNDSVMLQKLCYTAMTRASESVTLAGYEVFWDSNVKMSVAG